ncbi:hypothetical protein D3C85_1807650 [compost metagenome]
MLSADRTTDKDSISLSLELVIVKLAAPVPELDFISQSCNVEVPKTENVDLLSKV